MNFKLFSEFLALVRKASSLTLVRGATGNIIFCDIKIGHDEHSYAVFHDEVQTVTEAWNRGK